MQPKLKSLVNVFTDGKMFLAENKRRTTKKVLYLLLFMLAIPILNQNTDMKSL